MKIIGLDFEASGSDPWEKHVPIQIGMVIGTEQYGALIGGWDWNTWEWNTHAATVHNITKEQLAAAEPVWKVDLRVAGWMLDRVGSRMWNIPVGWNVAGYDRQFITRWMPNVNRLLSYRSVDLGALAFALGGDEKGYAWWKRAAKNYAANKTGYTEDRRHDAVVDAACAVWEYEFLSEAIRDRSIKEGEGTG